jgi:RimJ/RimL family protein N-acetyltransferase
MEKMPFQPGQAAAWRQAIPELQGTFVTMREAQPETDDSLWSLIWPTEAVHLLAPPPRTRQELHAVLSGLLDGRQAGREIGFVACGGSRPIGLIQVRALEPSFQTAEWAFAFAPDRWSTQAPAEAARLVRDFLFEVVGTHRLESRSSMDSAERIDCLRRLGAREEGVLRRSAPVPGGFADQILWAIVKEDHVH